MTLPLPADFQFSQGSLQDYVDCPRRFQLRYVERLRWPALEAEPALDNERYLRRGAAFHRLVQQHLVLSKSGIAAKRLSPTVSGDELRCWWRNYLESGPADLPATRYPEVVLSAPLGGYRLAAKYDLVAVEAGDRAVIVDWKTNRKRPRREWLAERLQTRVYPYMLVRAGLHLNEEHPPAVSLSNPPAVSLSNPSNPLEPEQVEMVYWFANYPAAPERFAYDAAQYEKDERYLTSLIEEIVGGVAGDSGSRTLSYRRTDDEWIRQAHHRRHCRYCRYRSLCGRGVGAGPLSELEEEPASDEGFGFDFDFEQIAEVEY